MVRRLLQSLTFTKTLLALLALLFVRETLKRLPSFGPDADAAINLIASTGYISLSLLLLGWLGYLCAKDLLHSIRLTWPSAYHLGRTRLGIFSKKAPDSYIKTLFDTYANTFNEHLTQVLEYEVPQLLLEALNSLEAKAIGKSTSPFHLTDDTQNKKLRILDMGCGTGLCGELFKPFADELIGIDLSPNMLEKAKATRHYDQLICATIVDGDKKLEGQFDLIIAADVLVYVGDLEEVFATVRRLLVPNGVFAFSLEGYKGVGWRINRSGRYSHSQRYIHETALKHDLNVELVRTQKHRLEDDEPVMGDIYLVRYEG